MAMSLAPRALGHLQDLSTYDAEGLWKEDGTREWTWERHDESLPEYFRFAYMAGNAVADYTKAGTWLVNGTWVPIKSGPS